MGRGTPRTLVIKDIDEINLKSLFIHRKEYVDLFLQHKLNNSVQHSFNSFKDGFLKVCGGKVLHFLHPQELMELVVGSQDYDFVELEKVNCLSLLKVELRELKLKLI